MFGQKNTLIILLTPHALEIFANDSGNVSTITIPSSVVNNLEVIDRDELYALISTWCKSITYQSTEIIWLLSDTVIFDQIFPEKESERWDTMTVQFLDTVPFEEVISRVYNPVEGRHVVATNQDLINALKHGFSVQGYITQAVVPAKLVGITSPLNAESAKKVMSSMSQILRDNLVTPDNEKSVQPPEIASSPNQVVVKKPKSQLPLLLSVFGVLVAILLIVIYLNK